MKHKQLLALFLCFIMIFSSKIVSQQNDEKVEVKNVVSSIDEFTIKNISEEDDIQKINIFYPVTKVDNVNNIINEKIQSYRGEFNSTNYITDKKELTISFDTFKYNEYTSFKFNIKSNVGITHDLDEVFTITFKDDNIIQIEDLQSNIIEVLYDKCIEELKSNDKFLQYSNDKWLSEGVIKDKSTFSNFILTDNELIVYFNPCVVAPYAAGIISVEVPYNNLDLCID